MTKRRIVVDVRRDGTINAATHGFVGPKCLDAVSLIEDLAQATIESSELTDDFHRQAEAEVTRDQNFDQGGAA